MESNIVFFIEYLKPQFHYLYIQTYEHKNETNENGPFIVYTSFQSALFLLHNAYTYNFYSLMIKTFLIQKHSEQQSFSSLITQQYRFIQEHFLPPNPILPTPERHRPLISRST